MKLMVRYQGHFKRKKEKRIPLLPHVYLHSFFSKLAAAVFCKAESSLFLTLPCREKLELLMVAYATCVFLLCSVQLLMPVLLYKYSQIWSLWFLLHYR